VLGRGEASCRQSGGRPCPTGDDHHVPPPRSANARLRWAVHSHQPGEDRHHPLLEALPGTRGAAVRCMPARKTCTMP